MEGRANFFLVFIALIAGFGGFLLGFDSSMMADAHDQIVKDLALSNWQWSQLISVSLFGSIFGIPLSGFFADRLSRRFLLQTVALGFIISILCCAWASSFTGLVVGRFLLVFVLGLRLMPPLFLLQK